MESTPLGIPSYAWMKMEANPECTLSKKRKLEALQQKLGSAEAKILELQEELNKSKEQITKQNEQLSEAAKIMVEQQKALATAEESNSKAKKDKKGKWEQLGKICGNVCEQVQVLTEELQGHLGECSKTKKEMTRRISELEDKVDKLEGISKESQDQVKNLIAENAMEAAKCYLPATETAPKRLQIKDKNEAATKTYNKLIGRKNVMHRKKWACKVCNKQFQFRCYLLRHEIAHKVPKIKKSAIVTMQNVAKAVINGDKLTNTVVTDNVRIDAEDGDEEDDVIILEEDEDHVSVEVKPTVRNVPMMSSVARSFATNIATPPNAAVQSNQVGEQPSTSKRKSTPTLRNLPLRPNAHGLDLSKVGLGYFCRCGHKCKNLYCLTRHVEWVNLPKRFSCTLCTSKWRSWTCLRKHLQKVHGMVDNTKFSIGCRKCGKVFSSRVEHRRHLETVHASNPGKSGNQKQSEEYEFVEPVPVPVFYENAEFVEPVPVPVFYENVE